MVLSGVLDDGTSGLWHIKRLGGIAVVQAPEDAMFPDMPRNALRNVEVDHAVPAAEMGQLLQRLVKLEAPEVTSKPEPMTLFEHNVVAMKQNPDAIHDLAKPSRYTCPECQGTLFELHEGERSRYRCRTGHAYELASLLSEQSERAGAALWAAIRALQEKADLLKVQAVEDTDAENRERLARLADDATKQASMLREMSQVVEEQAS